MDGGFVRLLYATENADLSVVNAARVSYGKRSPELCDKDVRLLRYLAREKHDSPFRHAHLTFHIKAPEFVLRQWYKHVVGATWSCREPDHAWNEISMRYAEHSGEFYVPELFASQSTSNRQSSSTTKVSEQGEARRVYEESAKESVEAYKKLVSIGVSRESARGVLPLCAFTEAIWTASLQAVMHFVSLRGRENAQPETRAYAEEVGRLVEEVAPHSAKAWRELRTAKDIALPCSS